MKIAYGKLGRVVRFGEPSSVGGDAEVTELLERIRMDGHDVDIVTRHDGPLPVGVRSQYDPGGAYAELPTINGDDREDLCAGRKTERLDRHVRALARAIASLPKYDVWLIWLGEHNGPCWPYPKKDGSGLIRPYGSRLNLVWPLIAALNFRKVTPIWLCPDPRNLQRCNNYDKALTTVRPILSQYEQKDRGGDHKYGALEVLAAARLHPAPSWTWEERAPFGAIVNEGMKDNRPLARRNLVRPWVTDQGGELVGHWREETCKELGIVVPRTVTVDEVALTLSRWKATVTLPATCTGWATTKPYEAWAVGTVCFRHPAYDDQDRVYGRLNEVVRRFVTPKSPAELRERIAAIETNHALWAQVVHLQRRAFLKAMEEEDRGYRRVRETLENIQKRSAP